MPHPPPQFQWDQPFRRHSQMCENLNMSPRTFYGHECAIVVAYKSKRPHMVAKLHDESLVCASFCFTYRGGKNCRCSRGDTWHFWRGARTDSKLAALSFRRFAGSRFQSGHMCLFVPNVELFQFWNHIPKFDIIIQEMDTI